MATEYATLILNNTESKIYHTIPKLEPQRETTLSLTWYQHPKLCTSGALIPTACVLAGAYECANCINKNCDNSHIFLLLSTVMYLQNEGII